jgi:glycosyltransferase involved in cell wall biosynthesis
MVRFSIIIRTFNEKRYLPALLASLSRDLLASSIEIIVVDSGSTDGTLDIARSHGVRLLTINRNEFSFGRSLNTGCQAARGEVLVFISGHCVPTSEEWLLRLTTPLLDGKAQYSYGRQIGGCETRFSEQRIFRKYFPPSLEEAQGGCFCNNANAALLAAAWKRYRFCEDLPGLEDMELAKRILKGGGTLCYMPEAIVHHCHHETWRLIKRRYEREALALRHILPEIQLDWIDALRFFIAGVTGDAGEALKQHQLSRFAREILAFRFAQYYGTWRGCRSHARWSRALKERYFYPNSSNTNGSISS